MAEASGSGGAVETWYTYVTENCHEGLYKTYEDIGNSDAESLDFDLSDDENYLLSQYPSDLDFYDLKRGRISRRNDGRKLISGKARSKTSAPQTDETSSSSSKHNCYNGAGVKGFCSANKELRIKETRIENAKKKKENKAKTKKVRRVGQDEPVVKRGEKTKPTDPPSCLKKTDNKSVKPPTFYNNSDFVLSSGNSVKFDDQAFTSLLVELQNRDITPEDYDLLIQLDSSVKPKTLSEAQIDSLRSEIVTSILDDVCNICIEDYTPGEERKFLPCGHYFHGQCIRTWLSWTSNRCPVDGREVR